MAEREGESNIVFAIDLGSYEIDQCDGYTRKYIPHEPPSYSWKSSIHCYDETHTFSSWSAGQKRAAGSCLSLPLMRMNHLETSNIQTGYSGSMLVWPTDTQPETRYGTVNLYYDLIVTRKVIAAMFTIPAFAVQLPLLPSSFSCQDAFNVIF